MTIVRVVAHRHSSTSPELTDERHISASENTTRTWPATYFRFVKTSPVRPSPQKKPSPSSPQKKHDGFRHLLCGSAKKIFDRQFLHQTLMQTLSISCCCGPYSYENVAEPTAGAARRT